MPGKTRLDRLLMEKTRLDSRSKAAAQIMAGEVTVDGKLIDKPGSLVRRDAVITLKAKPRYVGRGGIKLEAALAAFDVTAEARICADVGASTGGFTDCLLQHGAARVYAIDVGRGVLDYRLRVNERVIVLESTNARHLDALPERPALVVIDVSFISVRLILPAVKRWAAADADIIALVKPQFEVGKGEVGKGGIVRDAALRRRALRDIVTFAESLDMRSADVIPSPITGAKGNVEYLLWLRLTAARGDSAQVFSKIDALHAAPD